MSDFDFYDEKMIPEGFGLHNMGATCYFNAVIQSLISCSAFNKNVQKINKTPHDNNVLKYYGDMITLSTKDPKDNRLSHFSPLIWKEIFKYVQTRSDITRFSTGQQDAGEGLHMFMQAIEKFHDLQDLFKHRYESTIYCQDCKKNVSVKNCEYILFDVPPALEIKQLEKFKSLDKTYGKKKTLQEFLLNQNTFVDKYYKCPKCGVKSEKFMKINLKMLPEIIVVMAKKYEHDGKTSRKINSTTDFPSTLTFNGYSEKGSFPMKYEAVAQIEHSGSLSSGHYWAVCKRKGGWQTLNDSTVREGKFQPTKNTYIVFYHIKK